MIGYKAARNYKCLAQIYEVGQEYKMDKNPILCTRGFHYCKNIKNIFIFYPMGWGINVFEIEDLNHINSVHREYPNKSATNHIKIVRELSDFEVVEKLELEHLISYDINCNQILTYKTINGFWITKVFDKNKSCEYYVDSFGTVGIINVKDNKKSYHLHSIMGNYYNEDDIYELYDNKKLIQQYCQIDNFYHIQQALFDLYNIKFSKTQKVASH
jgi:hypothetical protein